VPFPKILSSQNLWSSAPLQNEVKRYRGDQNHQQNREPIRGMLNDFKVDNLHLSRLRPLLLHDAGHHTDQGEADCHHEYYGDPIGGSPGDD